MQCFALYFLCSKAKHCRNVLGRVLGQKIRYNAPPLVLVKALQMFQKVTESKSPILLSSRLL